MDGDLCGSQKKKKGVRWYDIEFNFLHSFESIGMISEQVSSIDPKLGLKQFASLNRQKLFVPRTQTKIIYPSSTNYINIHLRYRLL